MTLTQILLQKVLLQKEDEDDDNYEEVEEAAPQRPLRFQVELAIHVI